MVYKLFNKIYNTTQINRKRNRQTFFVLPDKSAVSFYITGWCIFVIYVFIPSILMILIFMICLIRFWIINSNLRDQIFRCNQTISTLIKKETSIYNKKASLEKKEAQLSALEDKLKSFEITLTEKENIILSREEKVSIEEQRLKNAYERSSKSVSRLLPNLPSFETPVSDWPSGLRIRLFRAVADDLSISLPLSVSSNVVGSSGTKYSVSLSHCTCDDYRLHGGPCKHMLYLALCVGWNCFEGKNPAADQLREISKNLSLLEKKQKDIKSDHDRFVSLKKSIDRLLDEKKQTYPWLAKMIADLYTAYDKELAKQLRAKRNPAIKAADSVQQISKDYKASLVKQKQLEYQLAVYETAFPFLEEFKEVPPSDVLTSINLVCNSDHEYDHSRDWLSKEEYAVLSPAARDQLALDRYLSRSKSSWEAGIEYEQYIGYLCELRGYRVFYTGATKGLEDMGQDLVLQKGDRCFIIQCKRWSDDKVIHEKHIFQLYGSVVTSQISSPNCITSGVFVTSAFLSPLARECAQKLHIQVFEHIAMTDFPRIKCNLSRTGEKIYHLPFDLQYNNIAIDLPKNEFFANTVNEAVNAGFRRAFRWHSQ